MEKEANFLMEEVKEPFVSSAAVEEHQPTVLEFVTSVRKEAAAKYPRDINEKLQLVINDVRHSISVVCRDLKGQFILVNRKSIGNNPLANSNNRKEELAKLKGIDFPLASRGILPDSSFKVDDMLDDVKIKSMQYVGTAEENPGKLGAKGDSEAVKMPCYIADLDDEFLEVEGQNKWNILSEEEVLDLEPDQCSSKVLILKKYLAEKLNKSFND